MQPSPPQTRHLDGLRIIAAVAVVVLHYADYIKELPVGRFLMEHTWHFNLFVDLFFVVSGYVIASQYLGRVGDRAAVGRFIWRRLARIYPLHLATLLFYVAIALAIHAGIAHGDNAARYPFSDLPTQLLLLHAFDGARLTFNFPSWSLSAEMFCYLLFPAVAWLAIRRRVLIPALVVALVVTNTLYMYVADTEPWADWINSGGAFRALPGFMLGVACYLYRDRIAQWPALPGSLVILLVVFIGFGAALPVMAALAVIYAIAVLAIQHDCAGRATWLSALRFDRWAELTYSCYMLHIPVATIVLSLGARHLAPVLPGGKLTLIPVAMIVLAAVSVLSLRTFETPMRRYLNGLLDANRAPRGAVPAISGRDAAR